MDIFDYSKENIEKEYLELLNEIEKYNHHYYNLDESLVSDYEYDIKLKRLKEIENLYPELKKENSPTEIIGGTSSNKFQKVIHKVPMLSLANTYNKEDIQSFYNRTQKLTNKNFSCVLELKLDGLSISLIYEKGNLIKAITRGDGVQGEDVTENVKQISSIPHKLSQEIDIELRGEIVLPLSEFNRINSEREESGETVFANPRNAAAGTIRQLDSSIVKERNLDCYIYYVVDAEKYELKTHLETIEFIKNLKFKTTNVFEYCKNIDEIENRIDYWDINRKKLDYETDGLVIKINELDIYEEIGYTSKYPRWAIAYKFKAEQKETKVIDITYQVGRTGVITPVAELENIELSGSVVRRASLHNFDEINRLDLKINDIVLVEKAAEIIPQVIKVIKEKRTGKELDINIPKNCPSCNSTLYKLENQVALRCGNNKCIEKVKRRIEYFVSRDALNIQGLGEKIVEQLISEKFIEDVLDLFDLENSKDEIVKLNKMGEKKVNNLLQSIEESKKTSFDKVFYALGIEYVGKSTAKLLVKKFNNIDNILNANLEDFTSIDGIGEKVANSIFEYFKKEENLILINKLKEIGFILEYEEETLEINEFLFGKKFLATGKLNNFSRNEIKEFIIKGGGNYLSSISSNLDYLIVGNKESTKVNKARDMGIEILTEEEFLEKLKG